MPSIKKDTHKRLDVDLTHSQHAQLELLAAADGQRSKRGYVRHLIENHIKEFQVNYVKKINELKNTIEK